jgi:hypothetical protein
MIDPDLIFMAVLVAGLACPALLLAYAVPRDKRLRVLYARPVSPWLLR